jgi:hypothetical protein
MTKHLAGHQIKGVALIGAPYEGRVVEPNWSGARDLNPRPHSPEPYVSRVTLCPAGSSGVFLYAI